MPLLNSLEGWSYRLFGNIAPKFLSTIFEFKGNLKRAGMKIYPETYVTLMFLSAVLTIPVTVAALILLYLFKFVFLVFLVPMPLFIMIVFMITPSMKAGERASSLEREIPFASAYITVMATGGISPYMSIKRLCNVHLMPAMRREAREIMRDVEIFGVDPLSALEDSAKNHPLDTYRDFMAGYASTVITGGDISHFLEAKTHDIFKHRSLRIKAAAERLGTLLESFVIVMVLMSLCFYILFSVDAIYSTGVGMYSTMILYTYVFAPMLSLVFIYLAHDMQPKSPITEYRPYKVAAISSAVAAVLFLSLTGFGGFIQIPVFDAIKSIVDLPTALAVCLFIATMPAAIVHTRLAKKKSEVEKGIASFLRDLTEIRKTGMAPEKCIENLSRRNYGEFTNDLERISSQLSWGIPLRQVFMDFIKRTKSWLSQLVIFLLVEGIDVGGGTIAMIESLTRFNNMTQEVEREKKSNSRPFLLIPYFAAIMLVSTTLLTLIFVTKTSSMATEGVGGSRIDISGLSMTFSVSVMIHVFMIGLVAGKISEESIAAGFKHSALLVILTLVASVIVPKMVTF
ncbi:MAG TPA: type II secretion system F family protein [Candidatus Bathyarchaeia archaeon]|nr:type II secretion system F family protein [Candidatus Bathyarchaeia archaeon]